jgi:hypothetical protein
MVDKEEQFKKQNVPMEVTEFGIETIVKDEQPEKLESPIKVTDFGITMDDKDEHILKDSFLIDNRLWKDQK